MIRRLILNIVKEIFSDHITCRKQIWQLAISDLVKQYTGAAFGWAWAIIKPTVTIFVFWFCFTIGLRHRDPVNGYPFLLWLIAGYVPWFYMKGTLTDGANAIRKYKYLVQRIKYPVDTIPTFVSLSNFLANVGLFVVMVFIFLLFGYKPDIYYLQIPVYYLAAYVFFTLWSLFSSMLSSISKDFLNMVKSVTPALFWMSGIIYNVEKVESEAVKTVLSYNPVTFVASGFRNTFIYHRWFWEQPRLIVNYLIVTSIMFVLAMWAYWRLKKEIPDVL